jgi:hypothetical protein
VQLEQHADPLIIQLLLLNHPLNLFFNPLLPLYQLRNLIQVAQMLPPQTFELILLWLYHLLTCLNTLHKFFFQLFFCLGQVCDVFGNFVVVQH